MNLAQDINSRASASNTPISVFIELTRRCNLACYYCYHQNKRDSNELDTRRWIEIVHELADAGALYLTFSGGEPFLRPDLFEILAEARGLGFAVSVITNGFLVESREADRLQELGVLDVGVSFLASSAQLHDMLAGMPAAFERALHCVDLLRGRGIKVVMKHTVSSANFGSYRELAALADDRDCLLECDSTVMPSEPGIPSKFALSQEQHFQFLNEYLGGALQAPKGCALDDESESLHCDAGRSLCGITPDGAVRPCILLPVSLGNLATQSFHQCWESDAATRFRADELIAGSVCRECSVRSSCSRCHAVAALETGDWRSPAEGLCCRANAVALLKATFASMEKPNTGSPCPPG